ncbi:MAG: site-2 protease family protein [Euryarchaeota archaeon]|nr:site-2 protease family protein [Euryarchaeota archaeon]
MKTSVQIGKVMGMPIKIHISFLLVLVLFPVIFAKDAEFGFADVASAPLRYSLALTLIILLCSCVLLHELGYSGVAMRYGLKIRSITLIILGGIAAMDNIPRDPHAEMRIAIAGPLVALTIWVLCYLAHLGLGSYGIVRIPAILYISHFLGSIAYISIVLSVFNLVPAFPKDAGAMDALKMMSTENVGQLLVQDKESITGIVSGTDLTRSIEVFGYREQ